MDFDRIISKVQEFVKIQLSKDSSGHDYWHIERVVNNAKKILTTEVADKNKVILASLLHDVGDYKLHNGIDKTHEIVYPLLESLKLAPEYIADIITIISEVSYKGGHNTPPTSIEAKIVQDADRLDAIGAVGIARAFAYGGSKGREIFNPEKEQKKYNNIEEYQKSTSSTINHFYEKLLKLKKLMNTNAAKKIAEERHKFMELFLENFYNEVK